MRINYQSLSIVLIICIAFLLVNKDNNINPKEAVLNNIHMRTSVRSFTDEKIPLETIKELVKAGMAAPTAGNMQPWEFLVVDNKETLEKMGGIHKFSTPSKSAAAAIVVLADIDTYKNRPEFKPFWITDTSVATENIMLAATSMGIGSVWLSVYPSKERENKLRKVLNIPNKYNILCSIALGYPSEDVVPKDKWKAEKLHMNSIK